MYMCQNEIMTLVFCLQSHFNNEIQNLNAFPCGCHMYFNGISLNPIPLHFFVSHSL